jgi:predicted Fe-Mo cluster-binding NifX family protein
VFIGIAVITVGVILLSFALYSLYNSIDLYIDYNKGDQEAGKELIEDMMWNVGLTLGTLGIANSLRPLARKLTKTRLAKTLGRELTERLAKNMEIDDINRLVKGARNAGASDDVIREYAERAGKDGLDWLRLKGALNFTDNELRNLARLGDNLYNYSDEFLSAFKNSGYQDEIIEAVTRYGDNAVEVVTRYGDNAAEVISKYGSDAVEAITRYGDDALRAITNFGDDAVEVISKYGDDAVRAINKHGEDGLTAIYYYGDKLTDLIGKHGDDVVDQVIKYGDNAVEVITKYGDDAVEAITKYGDDAIEVITKYGDDALDAVSRNIEPDLIKRLDDLGIKPSEYDKFRIVGRESAETVAEAVEIGNSLKKISKLDEALEAIESVSFSGLDDTRITTMLKNIDDGAMSVSDKVTTKAKLFNKALDDGVVLPDMQVVKSSSFVDEVGNVKWPDKNGFVIDEVKGFPIMEEVNPKKGFVFDRYGSPDGRFVSPVENGVSVSYDQRSLPYIENPNAYHKYEVIKDFNELPDAIQNCTNPALKEKVIDYMSRYSIEFDDLKIFKGEIAPAFDATGGGTQLQFPLPVDFLNRLGIIKELF